MKNPADAIEIERLNFFPSIEVIIASYSLQQKSILIFIINCSSILTTCNIKPYWSWIIFGCRLLHDFFKKF